MQRGLKPLFENIRVLKQRAADRKKYFFEEW